MTQTLMSEELDWIAVLSRKSSVAGLPLKHSHSGTSRGMLRGPVTWQPATGKITGDTGASEGCAC